MSKSNILARLCYTELVYGRINKKLKINFSKSEIEALMDRVIRETEDRFFEKIGKNFYVTNNKHGIRITINSMTYRVITVDKI